MFVRPRGVATVGSLAADVPGDGMQRNVARYREVLSETPVGLETKDRPTVTVVQQES